MIRADNRYAIADGYCADGRFGSWHGSGWFQDFDVEQDTNDGSFVFSWTLETNSASGYAVFVFLNGSYQTRTTGPYWIFQPQAGQDRWAFEFLVCPNEGAYEDADLITTRNFKDSLRLTYAITGEVYKVQIFKNTVNETTIDYTGTPEKTYFEPVLSVSGTTNAAVKGKWPKGIEREADITITIIFAGATGTAQFQWSWGSLTGPVMTTQDYYQDINLNGIGLKFTSGASWTAGQTFTVKVQFKQIYESGDLPNGTHRYGVVTRNKSGFPTFSSEVSYSLSAIPEAPTVLTDRISYTNGTGTVTVWWRMPSDPGITNFEVYRNYPADGQDSINTNFVWDKQTTAPGEIVSVDVNNLQEGLNQIWARCGNDGEREENLIKSRYDLLLDSSLNKVSVPNAPNSFKVELNTDNSITVTVFADSSGDLIEIYHDDTTGTVDYSTVFATIANPQAGSNQKLTKTGLYLDDGTYLIGVRHKNGSIKETNTETKTLVIDTIAAPQATGLALELID